MKRGHLLVPFLALTSTCACLAQSNRPVVDLTQRAVTEARNAGRFMDAEKLLTDGIHELEQSDPQSPLLAQYLKELSNLLRRRGQDAEALAAMDRAYEIDRAAFGPNDLRVANDLANQVSNGQATGNTQDAEKQLSEALTIVRSHAATLRWNEGAGLAAGVVGAVLSFYIAQKRWVSAELLMPEETKLCDMLPEEFRGGFGLCGRMQETLTEIYRGEGRVAAVEESPRNPLLPPEITALNQAAEKYEKDGLYPSAEDTYDRAVTSAEKIDADPESRYGALAVMEMDLLGHLFEHEGLKDRAEKVYLRALEYAEQRAGPQQSCKSFSFALYPMSLVNLYQNERRLQDAERVVLHALDIEMACLGERHRAVVQTLTTLAAIYEDEGKSDASKLAQAATTYERGIAIQEANLGPNDPGIVSLLQKYADLLQKLHEDTKAAEIQNKIAGITAAQQKNRQ
jgi:tetratricopeptide (TPR) repeat protein